MCSEEYAHSISFHLTKNIESITMISLKIILVVTQFYFNSVLSFDFDSRNVKDLPYGPEPFANRIIGAKPADIKDFPYQVSFKYSGSHFCGGSLLSEKYVLTAAHCVENLDPSTVDLRAGSTHRKNGTKIPIAEVIPHPDYNNPPFDKDVAVMKTVNPIAYTDTIQPVLLPPKGRALVTVSGWGKTRESATSMSENLMAVEMPVVSCSICQLAYGDVFTENQWCAGNLTFGGEGAFEGDFGGAAIQDGMAVGIVSYVHLCGQPSAPTVFIDIAAPSIRDFITEQTGL